VTSRASAHSASKHATPLETWHLRMTSWYDTPIKRWSGECLWPPTHTGTKVTNGGCPALWNSSRGSATSTCHLCRHCSLAAPSQTVHARTPAHSSQPSYTPAAVPPHAKPRHATYNKKHPMPSSAAHMPSARYYASHAWRCTAASRWRPCQGQGSQLPSRWYSCWRGSSRPAAALPV